MADSWAEAARLLSILRYAMSAHGAMVTLSRPFPQSRPLDAVDSTSTATSSHRSARTILRQIRSERSFSRYVRAKLGGLLLTRIA